MHAAVTARQGVMSNKVVSAFRTMPLHNMCYGFLLSFDRNVSSLHIHNTLWEFTTVRNYSVITCDQLFKTLLNPFLLASVFDF